MKDVLLIGAGNIGTVLAELLTRAPGRPGYRVTVADHSVAALDELLRRQPPGARPAVLPLDVTDARALRAALAGRFAVVSAAPYDLTLRIAEAAREVGVHYLDLTEDVTSTRRIRELAAGASHAFIPQCGLAPGFVSIVAAHLARSFDTLDSLRLRVGALPVYPSNALNYNLTWSTAGVINEYLEPCEAIVEGRLCEVPALEECEAFPLDGVQYEAFNTSGGLGTLCDTLHGRVRTLNYRSIRYPGHAAIMKALLHDLRLKDRREMLADILEQALPATLQDVVIVFVTASGRRAGRLVQETWVRKIYGQPLHGRLSSAIQLATASSLAVVLDLLAQAALPQRGFVRQEDVALKTFLANRFGRLFAAPDCAQAA